MMLFVSNSQTPGPRKIPNAPLITIEQAVPIRTLYLQGLFLPSPEEAGSTIQVSRVIAVSTGGVQQVYSGENCMHGIPKHGITFPIDRSK